MKSQLTVDQAGRVLLPKALREELHLGPGDVVDLDSEGEEIRLRPVRAKARLRKKQGIWVFQGEKTSESISDLVDKVRADRSLNVLGKR